MDLTCIAITLRKEKFQKEFNIFNEFFTLD